MMTIGEKITFFRKKKGLSQAAMAELLEMSTEGYGKIERDETDVNYSRLELIATKLKIKPEDIVGFAEKTNNQVNGNNSFNNYVGENAVYQNFTDKDLTHENEKLRQTISHQTEKIALLESKIADLEKINALLDQQKK
jgi:transcriptional regulator with XRE-family HTH domain